LRGAVPVAFEDLPARAARRRRAAGLYERFEFRSWCGTRQPTGMNRWSRLRSTAPAQTVLDLAEPRTSPRITKLVLDQAALDAWLERLGTAELFAFDTKPPA